MCRVRIATGAPTRGGNFQPLFCLSGMNSTSSQRARRPASGKPDSTGRVAGAGRGMGRQQRAPASVAAKKGVHEVETTFERVAASGNWMSALESTIEGMGYELVDVERLPRGLLRISIDRVPGRVYPVESEFVTVDDCEGVTRQLQLVFEVESVDYERLEVSSPGLDRPLRKPHDWDRFCGLEVDVTFKMPFQGRRKYRGLLTQAQPQPRLIVKEGKTEQALDFALDEVREARLVPVVDFKGRARAARNGEQQT